MRTGRDRSAPDACALAPVRCPAALIGFVLGVVTVGDFATHLMRAFTEIDTDMAGLGGRDAMLESILYERDEYQRGNLRRAVGTDVETCFNGDIGREADAHQCDVVLYEIHFLAQSHEILLIVVKDMAQQAAQFLYGRLSLIRIKGDERVDIVQRIEQEMRVELIAQILQFRFRTAFLGFTAGSTCPHRPLRRMAALSPTVSIMEKKSRMMNIHFGGPMCRLPSSSTLA